MTSKSVKIAGIVALALSLITVIIVVVVFSNSSLKHEEPGNNQKFQSVVNVFVFKSLPDVRKFDPVVLNGSTLPELLGKPVDKIAGFAFKIGDKEGWTRIPIQIDERHYQDWNVIKKDDCR